MVRVMHGRRILLATTVAGTCQLGGLPGCGDDRSTVDSSGPDVDAARDAGVLGFDVSAYDAGLDDAAVDATGCPYFQVVCPDADYQITINGDGPQQVLRSNNDTLGEYPFPVQRYTPPGGEPGFDEVWGSSALDGGVRFQLFIDGVGLGALGYSNASGGGYCYHPGYCPNPFGDAGPGFSVMILDGGPPGNVIFGTYAAPAGNPLMPDAGAYLSGTFVTCRLCGTPPIP